MKLVANMKIARNKAPRRERNHCRLTFATKTNGKGRKNNTNNAGSVVNNIAIMNKTVTKKNFILGSKL